MTRIEPAPELSGVGRQSRPLAATCRMPVQARIHLGPSWRSASSALRLGAEAQLRLLHATPAPLCHPPTPAHLCSCMQALSRALSGLPPPPQPRMPVPMATRCRSGGASSHAPSGASRGCHAASSAELGSSPRPASGGQTPRSGGAGGCAAAEGIAISSAVLPVAATLPTAVAAAVLSAAAGVVPLLPSRPTSSSPITFTLTLLCLPGRYASGTSSRTATHVLPARAPAASARSIACCSASARTAALLAGVGPMLETASTEPPTWRTPGRDLSSTTGGQVEQQRACMLSW